eukprot:NODE_788_length_4230_cov_0.560881.p1 type:complete len:390 gc:universal NODE_788_length_4230_cov_0.560881:2203-3372(+)
MHKWFANKFLDLTLVISENQINWIRLDKYALLLGLPTENPFVETINQQHNFLGIENGDELLGGALEESSMRFHNKNELKENRTPQKLNTVRNSDRNVVLKDALGINEQKKQSPTHIGSLLGGYSNSVSPNIGGHSLLNLLGNPKESSSDTQDVLDMLTNMGINAREKQLSQPSSTSSSPDRIRKASVEVNVSSPRKWSQLPEHSGINLQDIELQQQLEQLEESPSQKNDWKGWAKINQPNTTNLSDIEAEQIKYTKPKQSGWASVVGQSSQGRKVVAASPKPLPRQISNVSNGSISSSKKPIAPVVPIVQQSKRSVEFVKWCKSECKKFGVPDPATNVITELAEKQLVVDSLLAMGVDPVEVEQFGEEFIRRIDLDEEMVVVKRRKRRN